MHMTRARKSKRTKLRLKRNGTRNFRNAPEAPITSGWNCPGFRHTSFTDIPLLRAVGNPQEMAKALESLRAIESYTGAFFDKFLKGAPDTLLDHEPVKGSGVEIKRYGKR